MADTILSRYAELMNQHLTHLKALNPISGELRLLIPEHYKTLPLDISLLYAYLVTIIESLDLLNRLIDHQREKQAQSSHAFKKGV